MTHPENRTRSNAYDEPDTSAPYGIRFKAQDEAFAAAMRKAIRAERKRRLEEAEKLMAVK